MENEKWVNVKGYEKLYMISNHGNVYSLIKDRIMTPQDNGKKYLYIMFYKDLKRSSFYVHRLVASHFIKNNYNKKFVNHKDLNKQNNHHANLEWVTAKENSEHAWRNGALKQAPILKGEDSPVSKMTILQIQAIRKLYPLFSVKEMSIIFNMSWSNIDSIIKNRTWKSVRDKI